jgi:hypothetical protein
MTDSGTQQSRASGGRRALHRGGHHDGPGCGLVAQDALAHLGGIDILHPPSVLLLVPPLVPFGISPIGEIQLGNLDSNFFRFSILHWSRNCSFASRGPDAENPAQGERQGRPDPER